jgi:hypothetical protein
MSKIIGHALEAARAQQRAQVAESENKKLMAVLEYVAMMTDVDIEEEGEENHAE